MRIEVQNIENEMISFTSEYGIARGIWKSKSTPEIRAYDVEISCDDIIGVDNISVSTTCSESIVQDNDKIIITGYVDEIYEDLISIKMGDGFIDFEISSRAMLEKNITVGCYASICVNAIVIYDENL